MSKKELITLPNLLLKQVCKPIIFPLDDMSLQNIQSLKNTFRQSFLTKRVKTLGLAAPQIGVLQRFFIIPKSINFGGLSLQVLKSVVRNFNVYINPKIIEYSPNNCIIIQNCLSIGDDMYKVERAESIRVEYYNIKGQRVQEKLSGIRARVFLHQNDHLDGITMDEKGQKVLRYNQVEKEQILSNQKNNKKQSP